MELIGYKKTVKLILNCMRKTINILYLNNELKKNCLNSGDSSAFGMLHFEDFFDRTTLPP